jgi:hypothetical protein
VHPSALEQLLARLAAGASLGFAHHLRIFFIQVLQFVDFRTKWRAYSGDGTLI